MTDPISPISGFAIPDTYGSRVDNRMVRLYNNQFFDYLTEQLPRNIKDMFKWCEVVYFNTPVLVNGIKKLINYPITDFTYKTDSPQIRRDTQEFVEEVLDLKTHLINLGLDYYIYGNVFRSIYFPFTRFLRCSVCQSEINVNDAKYKMRRGRFILDCPHCHTSRMAEVEDKYSYDLEGIKLVSWDPKQVDLSTNPVTGDTAYYYQPPRQLVSGIIAGDTTMVSSIPKVFLEAFATNKVIKFNANFRHIRTQSISGYSSGWGISPLVPVLKLYLYSAILRKSVESIGLEHITPKNILFPQGTSNDPTLMSSMGRWKEEVTKALNAWRADPNFVMLAPYPTGVVNVGSSGRGLMPTEEVKQVDADMLRALDIPPEFVLGGMTLQTGVVALRMLENQLQPYVSQLRDYANWIIRKVNAQCDKELCEVDFTPFKLADDTFKQQLLMQAAGSTVSRTTFQEALGVDPDEERDRLVQERIDDLKDAKRMEREQLNMEKNIATQVDDEMQAEATGSIPKYDQKQLIAQAQMVAQQMLQLPYEERRGALAQLSNEDYVMYALVSAQMDTMREQLKASGGGSGMEGGQQ